MRRGVHILVVSACKIKRKEASLVGRPGKGLATIGSPRAERPFLQGSSLECSQSNPWGKTS